MRKIIFWLFATLIFFVPLVLWPFTSEVFEFNKMVLVYLLTALITGIWVVRMIIERKIIFRRTILDIPLLVFFASQLISTILSIDPLTSWLGYYSRFNGGLTSVICYSLLYWAWVSNFEAKETLKLIYIWLASGALVSIYGVLEHFGIDKNVWVQDVQSRVFSTLGQPNWLASWLIALMPVSWALMLKSKFKSWSFWTYLALSVLFFWTLIFTKSRSGLLGIAVAFLIFWTGYFWINRKEYKKYFVPFGLITLSLILVSLISGTEFTPSISSLIHHSTNQQINQAPTGDTALETGGTESSVIRKIVWTGAIQIWLHYPVFGTGVETFAYSYYKFRPAAHNLTSEWDFLYNKAHNEFLNYAANSGSVGLVAYLLVIGFSVFIFVEKFKLPITNLQFTNKLKNSEIENSMKIENWNLKIALLAGFLSLSATNFFGFSVVPTQLEFFLFPAVAVACSMQNVEWEEKKKEFPTYQKVLVGTVLLATCYLLLVIGKYWFADTLYAKGTAYYSAQRPDVAVNYLQQAANLEPNQALYYGGGGALSDSYAALAVASYQAKDATASAEFTNLALGQSQKAADLSPANLNLKRTRFGLFIRLSTINPNYLLDARDTLIDAVTYAPTDVKLFYNLGLVYARTGQTDLALSTLKKTVELKSDYTDARLALAYLLVNQKQNAEAKIELEYILTNLDPTNSLAKQALAGIK